MVYGVVYAPNEVDTQGDYATAETIKEAAHRFMKELMLRNVDQQHDFQPERGYVAESWIIRGDDPLFSGEQEGTWAVGIKVEDPAVWEKITAGELRGISMAGTAKKDAIGKRSFREAVDADALNNLRGQLAAYLGDLVTYEASDEELLDKIKEAVAEYLKMKEDQ